MNLDFLVQEKRGRGRPSGISIESKTCPHHWDDCFGPLVFRETAGKILNLIPSDMELMKMSIQDKLWRALGYIGLAKHHDVIPSQSPCPYGLDCSSPQRTAVLLKDVEPLLIQVESQMMSRYGEWISSGESSFYHLATMLAVIGHHREAEEILGDVRFRRREYMVKGDL